MRTKKPPIGTKLTIEYLPTSSLTSDPKNARKHSQKQISKLKATVSEFSFTNPILVDERQKVIAGHARLIAAIELGMGMVPVVRLTHLTEHQKTALALADNKLSDMSEFDPDLLSRHLSELCAVDFNVELAGFDTGEVDVLLELRGVDATDPADDDPEPDPAAPIVTRIGDLWKLDNHVLLCGDALDPAVYQRLLQDQKAAMVFADPPYNVRIRGHVSGLGKAKHAEFAMASGEMLPPEFTRFLKQYMTNCRLFSTNGSVHFHFIDWRHVREMIEAGAGYHEQLAMCVWQKSNAGMGSLYRSHHELILVFKNGTAPHVNNVQLGRYGRYRTNIWTYAGANAFRKGRDEELALHPTVKPVALVADAILDCSKRGAVVLDPFVGSGTTLLAAERTGRKARGIEIDPGYVDTAIRRWRKLTGRTAILSSDGHSFDEIAAMRSAAKGADHVR